jgi:hypothetical protein
MTSLDDILSRLGALPEAGRAELTKLALDATQSRVFVPNPGPQTEAYFCPADLLLYGGQGGGGKTDLLIGLALEEHVNSLIMRRRYNDLTGITRRAVQMVGSKQGFAGSPRPKFELPGGGVIDFGAAQHLGDEESWQGQPHDFLGVDEAAQFLLAQVLFLMGWVRTTAPGQRTRTVLATNPPLSSDGTWLIGMFRPWLDLTHHDPAKPGELRWFVTDPDGKDMEVDGPGDIKEWDGKRYTPRSRTFIPAALRDNPFLVDTGYQATLDALPEPLRSAVRDGNFMAALDDNEFQVIPTAWVIAAQDRWTEDGWKEHAMTAVAIDPAGGGKDSEEIAYRHRGWYGPLTTTTGEETADGSAAGGRIIRIRKNNAPVVVDVGGGYASGVLVRLKDNGIEHVPFNGAAGSTARTKDGSLSFANKRAQAWWKFREELDPEQEGGSVIALPPDPELRSDLTAPCMIPRAIEIRGEIQLESKEDLRKRIGRSPGKGDAVVMCLAPGHRAVLRQIGRQPKVIRGYENRRRRR